MPDESKLPTLLKEDLESKVKKQKGLRPGISVPLTKLSRATNIERVFGQGLCTRIASIAGFDMRKGVLSEQEKKELRETVATINEIACEQLSTQIRFVSAEELEKTFVSGDPAGLVASAASSLSKWKNALPADTLRAIERAQMDLDHTVAALTPGEYGIGEVQSVRPGTEAAIGLVAGFVAGFIAVVSVIGILGEIASWFSGPELERHRYAMPSGIIIETETYLHVPWRGFCIGHNNQHFDAQYKVTVWGGVLDELRVRFEMRFEGGGFDRIAYPIGAFVWDSENGCSYPEPRMITSTRYHQIHELVMQQVGFVVIQVGDGVVTYGGDGIMTGAGLIPHSTAVKSGNIFAFPSGESIWQYGTSF